MGARESTEDGWARIKAVFHAALERPSPERTEWVKTELAEEPELAVVVIELLDAESGPTHVLLEAARAHAGTGAFAGLETVGPYNIEAELARGGMGRVFRATRENPRRAAAVKLMHRALLDANAVRRFEYESQILAELNHPNIAHVYDSGTVEYDGERIPWYAMELVEGGRRLDDVLPELGTTVERKLSLFLQVCEGVHHAHQRGIIHRDLKPGNVLVDADGRVKLIDFGIAKSVVPRASDQDDLTAHGQVVGTLAYMAPEQVSSARGVLDVRVDVYALGVILYRLCTGRMPYDLRDESIREAVAIICERPPDPQPLLSAQLPTDLRLIILEALEKRAVDRYDSVATLMAELRRFLAGEAIEARAPSMAYRLSRFASRNRALVASVVAVVAALAVAAGGSTWGLVVATNARERAEHDREVAEREHERAEAERQSAEQARDFALAILADADPWQTSEPRITLRKALERASDRLTGRDDTDQRTSIELHRTLSEVFMHHGDHAAAERETRRALALAEDLELADERLELLASLGEILLAADRSDEAEQIIAQVVSLHEERYGTQDDRTWRAKLLASSLREHRGQLNEARDEYAAAVESARTRLGPEAELTVDALSSLAHLQHVLGELGAAEIGFSAVWRARSNALGERHPLTLAARQEVLGIMVDQGRLDEANEGLAALIAAFDDVLGEGHSSAAGAIALRATVLRRQGRPHDAIPLARKALAIVEHSHGPDHLHALRGKNNLALTLVDTGELDEAEMLYEQLSRAWSTRDADADGSYLVVAINYAQLLKKRDRLGEALAVLDRAIERAGRDYPDELWLLEYARSHRARLAGGPLGATESFESEKARALHGLPAQRGAR